MSRVKVTINKKGYIPSLGQGPIRRPILITEELYNQLVALGYPVKVITPLVKPTIKKEETAPVDPPIEKEVNNSDVTETTAEEVKNEPAEEVVTEEVVESSEEETTEEETVEEETTEEEVIEDENVEGEEVIEIVENDPDLSPEAYYTEDFLTSKALCKKILSGREIQYEKDASFTLLKQLVIESNPEVEIVSE